MKRLSRLSLLLAVFAMASACSTVTIRDKGTGKFSTEPTYEDTKSYFFWGLAGEHHIDVKDICNGKQVKQIQAVHTFMDSFLTILTLGIYAPRTAKVWCAQ